MKHPALDQTASILQIAALLSFFILLQAGEIYYHTYWHGHSKVIAYNPMLSVYQGFFWGRGALPVMAKTVSRGPNMAAIFGPGLNMAAKFGPRQPYLVPGDQMLQSYLVLWHSFADRFGPTLQYLVLLLGTKFGSKILS